MTTLNMQRQYAHEVVTDVMHNVVPNLSVAQRARDQAEAYREQNAAMREALEWMIECYATAPMDRREGGYVLTKKQALDQARAALGDV